MSLEENKQLPCKNEMYDKNNEEAQYIFFNE